MSVWCYLPFVFIPAAAILFYCLGYNFALKRRSEIWLDRNLDPRTENVVREQTPLSGYFSADYDNRNYVPQPTQQHRQYQQQQNNGYSRYSRDTQEEQERLQPPPSRSYGPPSREDREDTYNNQHRDSGGYNGRSLEEGRGYQQQESYSHFEEEKRVQQQQPVQQQQTHYLRPQTTTPIVQQQQQPPTVAIRRTAAGTMVTQPAQTSVQQQPPISMAQPTLRPVTNVLSPQPQRVAVAQDTQIQPRPVYISNAPTNNTTATIPPQQQTVRHVISRPIVAQKRQDNSEPQSIQNT